MLKNCFSRFAGRCCNVCILGLSVALGSQITAVAQGPVAPMPVPPQPVPGGSTFADQCLALFAPEEGDETSYDLLIGCVAGKCDDLHPGDVDKINECINNGARHLRAHQLEDTDTPTIPGEVV